MCLGDHSATLAELAAAFDQELDPVKHKPFDDGNEFEIAISELEERLTIRFTQFEKDIRGDKLLLAHEQSDMIGDIATVRDRCLQSLRAAVERREQAHTEKDRTAQFCDIEIEADFEAYLKSNPLLMEITGAKVIRRNDGLFVVFAIGSTVVKEDSAKERLRAEKVCRLKALASLVAETQSVQIAHVEVLKDETVVVIENGAEKTTNVMELLKITKAKVEGITRDMPVIGRWRSAEGDTFYLAIGAIIDRSGKPVPSSAK